MRQRIMGVLLGLVLTACGVASPAEGTLSMQNATLGTQMAWLRQTATFEADLNVRTLEYIGTTSARAQGRQVNLLATLQYLGMPLEPGQLAQITPDTIAGQAASVASGAPTPAQPGITVIQPTTEPNLLLPSATPAPALDPNAPNVTNMVTAAAVGSDDCALAAETQFTASTPEIYAVGVANNFPPGITVTFNWRRGEAVVYSDAFTFENAVNNACIWYFVTPLDFDFTPGEYTVSMEASNVPLGTPAVFIISG